MIAGQRLHLVVLVIKPYEKVCNVAVVVDGDSDDPMGLITANK